MFHWYKKPIFGILLLFIFGCETGAILTPATAESIMETVAKHKGNEAVLLNVWATWCEPCVEEFPMIVELGDKYSDVSVYFVSVDFADEQDKVKDFLIDHHVSGLSYIKEQKDMPFINGINTNWTGALPFTIVYRKSDGSIVDYWEGKVENEKFTQAIDKALQ